MIVLTTLRDFADRHSLHLHCNSCGRTEAADWARLAARYGWDLPVGLLAEKLTCRECDSGDAGIKIAFNQIGAYRYGYSEPSNSLDSADTVSVVRQLLVTNLRLRSA